MKRLEGAGTIGKQLNALLKKRRAEWKREQKKRGQKCESGEKIKVPASYILDNPWDYETDEPKLIVDAFGKKEKKNAVYTRTPKSSKGLRPAKNLVMTIWADLFRPLWAILQ